MALVAAQQVDVDGLNPSMSAASGGGDEFTPGENIFLYISNASGAGITATVVTPGTVAGQAIGDVAIAVGAGGRVLAGPYAPSIFAAADGNADITWSATTSVTFAVCRL